MTNANYAPSEWTLFVEMCFSANVCVCMIILVETFTHSVPMTKITTNDNNKKIRYLRCDPQHFSYSIARARVLFSSFGRHSNETVKEWKKHTERVWALAGSVSVSLSFRLRRLFAVTILNTVRLNVQLKFYRRSVWKFCSSAAAAAAASQSQNSNTNQNQITKLTTFKCDILRLVSFICIHRKTVVLNIV